MNRRTKRPSSVLAAIAAVLVLATGCGSDDPVAGGTGQVTAGTGSQATGDSTASAADSGTGGDPRSAPASGAAAEQDSERQSASESAQKSAAAEKVAAKKAASQAAAKKAAAQQAATKAAKKAAEKKAAEQAAKKAAAKKAAANKAAGGSASSALQVTEADRTAAAAMVADLSAAERAGMVIMPIASQADGSIADRHYGGVILMGQQGVVDGTGDGTPAKVRNLVDGLQQQRDDGVDAPLLIGVDQEYGQVARLVNGFTEFPGAAAMAATGDTGLTEKIAAAAATEMRAVGVSVDFAPDADLLPQTGESAIGDRSYGMDPETVGAFVAAAVTGYQKGGVAATIKHFPGIGGIAADTHTELPVLEDDCAQWSQTDAVPMRAGADAGAALAMTGHVHFPAVGADGPPASLSSRIVTDLLRGNGYDDCVGIGYQGVTVTDSMQMAPVADNYSSGEAAWRALAAGQDLLLMPIDPAAAADGIVSAVESGELTSDRLAEAATEVLALRLATARVPQPSLDVVRSSAHLDLARQAGVG